MEIVEINSQEVVDAIESSQQHVQLLHSWEWKCFQESIGRKTRVFGLEKDGRIFGYGLVVFHALPWGQYLYCPRGPLFANGVFNDDTEEGYVVFLEFLQEMAKHWKACFLRLEPPETITRKLSLLRAFERSSVMFQPTSFVQPTDTLLLNLGHDEGMLLKNMRGKTRYNIHLAKRHGVTARKGTMHDFPIFWRLVQETAIRQHIRTHPRSYYEALLKTLHSKNCEAVLYLAEYEDIPLASSLVVFYRDTAIYLHGGTSALHRNLMASYLLHWHTIQDAKRLGFHYYDFYGVAPHGAKATHSLENISRFKRGFGGQEVNFIGTFDFVFQRGLYRAYTLARAVRRRMMRGLR